MFRNLAEDATIEIYFETFASTGAPVAPSSAFTTSDFAIYKNGSATAKATTNGLTVTSPFNSETGCHLLVIDTSNDTGDSGFWTTGARYQVKFNTAKTVDSKSIDGRSVPRGSFGIQSEYMRGTDSAALASGVTVTAIGANVITAASIADNAIDTATFAAGATLPRVTLVDTCSVNSDMRGTDNAALAATALSTVVWTGTLATNLATTNTTVSTNLNATISSRMASYTQPTGFLAATFPATVSSYSGGAVASVTAGVTVTTNNDKTGYSLTAGTGLGNQTANITGNLSGSVGSVTGAVVLDSAERNTLVDLVWDEAMSGHTTAGTYGGRIVRATNSNTEVQITGSNHIAADVHDFQTGVITAGDFAANAITASALATDTVTEIQSGLATAANQTKTLDRLGYLMAQEIGACADAGTAAETYAITIDTTTYTIDHTGLDATGNRGTATLTKS